MTRIARGLAAVVLLTGMATAWASPASAQPLPPVQPLEGFYSYVEEGLPDITWRFIPTCVPTYCSLHVTSSTVQQVTFEERASNYGGVAALQGGLWNLYFPTSQGIKCADGSTAPTEDTWWINPYLLTGTHTKTWKAACGLQPDMVKKPFPPVFKSPLPTPIDRFPLHCQALQPDRPD